MGNYALVDVDWLEQSLTTLADKIRGKGGTTEKLDFPQEYFDAVDAISAGGVLNKDCVNFYDYDGTLLYSYDANEVAAMTELPPLPEHDGLVCQGWNYDLATIKAYNRAVNVGAMYTTDDGTTRIYITLNEGRTSPMLGVCPKGTVTVDWGDGSEPDVLTGTSTSVVQWTPTHHYASAGDYVIRLSVEGSVELMGAANAGAYLLRHSADDDGRNGAYLGAIRKVEIGEAVAIGGYALYKCGALTSVTIPVGLTTIGGCAFHSCSALVSVAFPKGVRYISGSTCYGCFSITSVSIPDSVTTIYSYAFIECHALASVTIPNRVKEIGSDVFHNCFPLASIVIPNSVTSIGTDAFHGCYALADAVISNGITSIPNGMFRGCYSLASIVIPNGVISIGDYAFNRCAGLSSITIPDGVTRIGAWAFNNCYSLVSVAMPDGVTSIGEHAFHNCHALVSVNIPDSVTAIGDYAFHSCYALASVTISYGVGKIGAYAFYDCRSLAGIVIPKVVTAIGEYAFFGCSGVAFYDFTRHTSVPTLSATSALSGIPDDCEIRVPSALYDEWISAENWSVYAYMITL